MHIHHLHIQHTFFFRLRLDAGAGRRTRTVSPPSSSLFVYRFRIFVCFLVLGPPSIPSSSLVCAFEAPPRSFLFISLLDGFTAGGARSGLASPRFAPFLRCCFLIQIIYSNNSITRKTSFYLRPHTIQPKNLLLLSLPSTLFSHFSITQVSTELEHSKHTRPFDSENNLGFLLIAPTTFCSILMIIQWRLCCYYLVGLLELLQKLKAPPFAFCIVHIYTTQSSLWKLKKKNMKYFVNCVSDLTGKST